jgi:hypothetical protein
VTHADVDTAVGSTDAPDGIAAAVLEAADQEPETPAATAHKVHIPTTRLQRCKTTGPQQDAQDDPG